MNPRGTIHPGLWKWTVCALLLFASAINYLDRQTLSNAAVRITREFRLSQEQYGNLEWIFGWAFAAGSLVFGWLADRVAVRWLYPAVLVLWSATGFVTGWVQTYPQLLGCRLFLGFFEAGHWPCALKTTQRLLAPADRTMGNSVLQSGTSIGAVITPLLMSALMTSEPGAWRWPFKFIGAAGVSWVIFWLLLVRKDDLTRPPETGTGAMAPAGEPDRFQAVLFTRRFAALVLIIILINTSWQILRAWLPKFLQEARGYSEHAALYFNACYYVATDIGCLGAGALSLWLHRRGQSVHRARSTVFLICALGAALTTVVAILPKGNLLLATLLVVGAAALGLFPCYYALSQELTTAHQGKVTGLTGVFAWFFSAPAHKFFGRLIDQSGSYDLGLAVIGWAPLVAWACLFFLWDRPNTIK